MLAEERNDECRHYEPVSLAPQVATRYLEKTIWAIICDYLFAHTSWAANLLTVFAIKQILEWIEAVIGARCTRVECALVIVDRLLIMGFVVVFESRLV